LFISLLDFQSKFFLKMLASNCCTEGSKGKHCVSFFSFVIVSAGSREKGRNKPRGKSTLPSTEIFLKGAVFSLAQTLEEFVFCLWRRFSGTKAFSFVRISPPEWL
jgi:hypothetical protein